MRLFLSRLHFPVTTLGLGRRIGIWFQGCSLRCPGCVSADTWAYGHGETSVADLLMSIGPWLSEADGVTVSGGEPFEQIEALELLLRGMRAALGTSRDIFLYSGFDWEKIAPRVSTWNALADVLISDPFRADAGQTLAWRGSDNQRMHLLTDLGHSRYAEWVAAPRTALPNALDVFFSNGEVWMAGIPAPGSLEALRTRLSEVGFCSTTSQARHAVAAPVFA